MYESIAFLIVVLLGVWILYKVGVFLAVTNLTSAAVIASDDFASKTARKSADNAVKYQIEPETFRQAMASKARNKAFRQAMVEGQYPKEEQSE